jgi:hypothetical protein
MKSLCVSLWLNLQAMRKTTIFMDKQPDVAHEELLLVPWQQFGFQAHWRSVTRH